MNKFEEHLDTECEFEPMISALVDDELADEQKSKVIFHLANCESCQALHDDFHKVDSLVQFSDERIPRRPQQQIKSRNLDATTESIRIVSTSRFVPAAVAATLLMCFCVFFVQDQPAEANPVSPEEVAQPMSELHSLNKQQRRDQELMLKVLGMDLRTLKLEIAQLPNHSQERISLTQQVDMMLQKIRTFKTSPDMSLDLN